MENNNQFWGITTFFNPAGYKNKLENYKKFRESSKKQGLKLLSVELVFGDNNFELKKGDAEMLIQLRTDKNNVMWQKERLLNIGLENLPKNCDKFAWLDCDVIFKNNNWIKETSELLKKYIIIQPYEWAIALPKGAGTDIDIETLKLGKENGQKIYSFGYWFCNMNFSTLEGHNGLAWAARKSVFKKNGFYDKLILGSADTMMCNTLSGKGAKYLAPDIEVWAKAFFKETKRSVCYAPGVLVHLWHGHLARRLYGERYLILKKYDFDPNKDIRKDKNKIWEWSSDKPGLHKEVKKYFEYRNENGNILTSFKLFPLRCKRKFYIIAGMAGAKIKKVSPFIYLKLKKYFPDY